MPQAIASFDGGTAVRDDDGDTRYEARMRSWTFLFICNLMWALQFTCIKLVQDQVGSLFTVWGPMTLATVLL
jgi:hypothetical protein